MYTLGIHVRSSVFFGSLTCWVGRLVGYVQWFHSPRCLPQLHSPPSASSRITPFSVFPLSFPPQIFYYDSVSHYAYQWSLFVHGTVIARTIDEINFYNVHRTQYKGVVKALVKSVNCFSIFRVIWWHHRSLLSIKFLPLLSMIFVLSVSVYMYI